MPKTQRRKRRKPLATIPDEDVITLSTLAAGTVIKQANPLELTEDYYAISMDITVALRDFTPAEGPIKIGWANDDLTVAEIAEAINAQPLGPSDIIEIERARRPVREFGLFPGLVSNESLNNGVTLRVPIRRLFSSGVGFVLWAQNRGAATLTTGAVVSMQYRLYGRWVV